MRKRILALLLVLTMSLVLFGCTGEVEDRDQMRADRNKAEATEREEENTLPETTGPMVTEPAIEGTSRPLLYKVTDDSGNVIWLFGSIHVGREDYYPLPNYVMDAFEGSDALAVEFDIVAFENNFGGQINAMAKLVYSDGTTIKDHIPEQTYDRAVEILQENGYYSEAFDYYIPMFWYSLIENCTMDYTDADVSLGIDRYFIDLAYEMDKEVLDVESAEFQYNMMAAFSEELQIYMLEGSIAGYEDLDAMAVDLEAMMDLWSAGDEESFSAYLNTEEVFESEQEEQLYEEYNNAMIVERNQSMTEYAQEALRSGEEVFICVGAAHVVGEGAMAEMLRELGYQVELVS